MNGDAWHNHCRRPRVRLPLKYLATLGPEVRGAIIEVMATDYCTVFYARG